MIPEPAGVPAAVLEVLADGQRQGLIGPGPLFPHVRHALGFIDAMGGARGEPSTTDRIVDLGPGGGLPGLVLASVLPELRFTFVEGSTRRGAFLVEAVHRCGLSGQVEVVVERAELAARNPGSRGMHSVVVARSFGPPATTAECAVGFLAVGGILVVSEPPKAPQEDRWPVSGLEALGLRLARSEAGYTVLEAVSPCPERFPRRVGVPRKRRLF